MTAPYTYRGRPEHEWAPYVGMWLDGVPSRAIRERLASDWGLTLKSHQLQDTMRRMGHLRQPETMPPPRERLLTEEQEAPLADMWRRGDSPHVILQFVLDEYGVSATENWLRQRMAKRRTRREARHYKLVWTQEHDAIVRTEFAAGLHTGEIARILSEHGMEARAHDVAMRARILHLDRPQVIVHAPPPPGSAEEIALRRFHAFRFAGAPREDVVRKPQEKYRVPPGGYRLGMNLR